VEFGIPTDVVDKGKFGNAMNPTILFATTPTLEIAYEQTRPISGEPVLLLLGFPYDVLAAAHSDLPASGHVRTIGIKYPQKLQPLRFFRCGAEPDHPYLLP
jgi:hypothetical protein